jgi:DNA-binding SARP family transcriptional activator
MELGVLGPLTVHVEGREIGLVRPKERSLLAVIALGRGLPVNRERISDALWGDDVPRGPAAAVRTHVRRLRATLGPEAIATSSIGYASAPDTIVDADCFRVELQCRGDAHERAATIGRALARWRGRPYDDLGDWEPVVPERRGLYELHAHAREEWATARLDAGETTSLVPLLEELVSESPLVERRWELLMLALYGSGRQADALRAFQRCRRSLGDAGLEPGPALLDLDRAIAGNDVAVGNEQQTVAALVRAGIADRRAGRRAEARATFEDAERHARRSGEATALAEVAVARSADGTVSGLNPDARELRLLDDALEALPNAPTALRARVLARLAIAGCSNRDPRQMAAYANEALAIARLVGDNAALVSALHARLVTDHDPAHIDALERLAREMVEASSGDTNASVLALSALARTCARRCDVETASRYANEASKLARSAPPDIALATLWFPLFRATLDGNLKAALAAAERTEEVARSALGDPDAGAIMGNAIKMVVRMFLGGETPALPPTTRLDEIVWPLANLGCLARAGAAVALARDGQFDLARTVFAEVTPAALSAPDRDMYWPGVVWAVSSAAHLLGDTERAAALYSEVLPFAGQLLIDPAGGFVGCTDHYLALLARTSSRESDVRQHLAHATRIYDDIHSPWWSQRSRDMEIGIR